jgi:mevalonate kinase
MIKVSAPGSLMIMGEHAVLHGYSALAMAINKRLNIQITPRNDRKFLIHASTLGNYQGHLDTLPIEPPFHFALKTLEFFQSQLPCGINIDIQSEIDPKKGLGSSAALVLALLVGLFRLIKQKTPPKKELFLKARRIIRSLQGRGSGSDVVASLYGGLIAYSPKKEEVTPIENVFSFCTIYAGYKTPTAQVIKLLEQAALKDPQKYKNLYQKIGEVTERGILALKTHNTSDFIQAFLENQSLMVDLGVSDQTLDTIIEELHTNPYILGAKISGSGLGDCVLGLLKEGETIDHCTHGEVLDVSLSSTGVKYD